MRFWRLVKARISECKLKYEVKQTRPLTYSQIEIHVTTGSSVRVRAFVCSIYSQIEFVFRIVFEIQADMVQVVSSGRQGNKTKKPL